MRKIQAGRISCRNRAYRLGKAGNHFGWRQPEKVYLPEIILGYANWQVIFIRILGNFSLLSGTLFEEQRLSVIRWLRAKHGPQVHALHEHSLR